jgi:hypothetical protein
MVGEMKSRRKTLGWVGALLACVAVAVAVYQLPSYLAFRRLQNGEWMVTATSDELRVTAHRALGLWLANPHDAFIILGAYGDESSIPYLRAALAKQPSGDDECTWSHGREALARVESITVKEHQLTQ